MYWSFLCSVPEKHRIPLQRPIPDIPPAFTARLSSLEVTVDADSIRSIHLANLSESTAAMFPLVEPVLDSLASQIYSTQSLENLDYASDQKYTAQMLIQAIEETVQKAASS